MVKPANKPARIAQYVGYADVADAFGVSARTVRRMVDKGKFPPPIQLSPNRVGWKVETIDAAMAERSRELVTRSVTRPEDIPAEKVADTIQRLGARYLTETEGRPVSPDDIVGLTRKLTQQEAVESLADSLDNLRTVFSGLDEYMAWHVIAGLIPAARHQAKKRIARLTKQPVTLTDDELFAFAMRILNGSVKKTAKALEAAE